MKMYLMFKDATWWAWFATGMSLLVGLIGNTGGFVAAIALSLAHSAIVVWKYRSLTPYPVQIPVAYAVMLIVCLLPELRWVNWLAMLGTFARLFFGYCPMARILSLMPWNRREPLTGGLLARTFFSAPVMGRADHGLPLRLGRCELEAHAGQRHEPAS